MFKAGDRVQFATGSGWKVRYPGIYTVESVNEYVNLTGLGSFFPNQLMLVTDEPTAAEIRAKWSSLYIEGFSGPDTCRKFNEFLNPKHPTAEEIITGAASEVLGALSIRESQAVVNAVRKLREAGMLREGE